jgi:peptidyl-prolyl cis-trans isomerase SDCCAG10
MGEAEMEEGSERPLYPVKITGVEILVNPFDDMKRRERIAHHLVQKPREVDKKQKKRKGGKQLLSFGDEEGDGDDLPIVKKAKFDTRVVMDVEEITTPKDKPVKAWAKKEERPVEKVSPVRSEPETEAQRTARPPSHPLPSRDKIKAKTEEYSSPEPESAEKKSLLERTNEEIAALKASMKRTIHTEPVREKKKSVLEQMMPETSTRGRKRRPWAGTALSREDRQALDTLETFRSKLEQAPPGRTDPAPLPNPGGEHGRTLDGDEEGVCDLHFIANCQSCQSWDKYEAKEESDDEGWMSHSLSFAADKLGKDLNYRKKAEEELVVIDPLAKARTLKEEKRAEREARAGGSGRAWDQVRNAQMAKASALAGRGAK